MRYIALEEAFSIPGLTDGQPPPWPENRFSRRHLADWARKLPDFTEYRLPEMDAAGIDIQVLSLTVPGLQAESTRRQRGTRPVRQRLPRQGVAEHPDRFHGFAALPMQDPGPPPPNSADASASSAFEARWSTTTCRATISTSLGTTRCGRRWKNCRCRCTCIPARRPPITGRYSTAARAVRRDLELGRGDRRARAAHHLRRSLRPPPWGHADPRAHGGVPAVHAQPPGLALPHPGPGNPAAAHALGLHRLKRGGHHQRGLLPAALTGAVLEIGADAVMFSVDYPYESSHEAVAGLERTTLSDTDRDKIAHGNAERILRL